MRSPNHAIERTADPRHASCVRTCRATGRGPLITIVRHEMKALLTALTLSLTLPSSGEDTNVTTIVDYTNLSVRLATLPSAAWTQESTNTLAAYDDLFRVVSPARIPTEQLGAYVQRFVDYVRILKRHDRLDDALSIIDVARTSKLSRGSRTALTVTKAELLLAKARQSHGASRTNLLNEAETLIETVTW